MQKPLYLQMLVADLRRRRARNPRLSLRGYARLIGVDPGQLSRLLTQKKTPTVGLGKRLAEALGLAEGEQALFLGSITEIRSTPPAEAQPSIHEIRQDQFAVIGQLYHYAILELTFAPDFDSDYRAIARRLGLTTIEVEQAVARLTRLGLLEWRDGRLVKTDRHLRIADATHTAPALKDQQREILARSRQALEHDPIERRVHSGITMCIDPDKIELARTMIDEFAFKLCEVLESGARRNVYQLAISLFDLSRHKDLPPAERSRVD